MKPAVGYAFEVTIAPPATGPFGRTAAGTPVRTVRCRTIEQAFDVIETEGRSASTGTRFTLVPFAADPSHTVPILGKWHKTARGMAEGSAPPR